MRIAFITAGAAGMYCGSCMRDNTLVAALNKLGHEALLVPTYTPILFPAEKFKDFKMPEVASDNHYLQYVEAVRGNGQTSAPFSYSGPLTEMVLLGCLATRFPKTDLKWDTKALKVTNNDDANKFVKKQYRKGFEAEGL